MLLEARQAVGQGCLPTQDVTASQPGLSLSHLLDFGRAVAEPARRECGQDLLEAQARLVVQRLVVDRQDIHVDLALEVTVGWSGGWGEGGSLMESRGRGILLGSLDRGLGGLGALPEGAAAGAGLDPYC